MTAPAMVRVVCGACDGIGRHSDCTGTCYVCDGRGYNEAEPWTDDHASAQHDYIAKHFPPLLAEYDADKAREQRGEQ